MEGCVSTGDPKLLRGWTRYLSDGRTSEAAVGGPLELGHSFLLGRTNSTPERRHVLTAAAGVGLHGTRQRDNDNVRVISKKPRDIGHHDVKRGKD